MKIVLLLGPSSAGKTTLCEELRSSRQWEVLSSDDIFDKIRMDEGDRFREELNKAGLIERLLPYMPEESVVRLCQKGLLTISKGEHLITNYNVKSPFFPEIEGALGDAGFEQAKIKALSDTLRDVGQVYLAHQFPNLEETMLNQAFSHPPDPNKTIIIDTIPGPTPSITAKLLANFDHQADNYRKKYGDASIETFTVLAYISPEQLSERVERRNIEADLAHNPKNKREGLFPVEQLSGLVAARTAPAAGSPVAPILATVSSQQLLNIAYKHKQFNPDDIETRPGILRFKRVGEAAIESVKLSKKFDMPKNNSNAQVPLMVRDNFHFDAMIDTSAGDPKKLADQLLDEIGSVQEKRAYAATAAMGDHDFCSIEASAPPSTEITHRYRAHLSEYKQSHGLAPASDNETDVSKGEPSPPSPIPKP